MLPTIGEDTTLDESIPPTSARGRSSSASMGDFPPGDGGREAPVFSCGGVGDEEPIQRTADEAAESKWSAVNKGYYSDPYIMQMCRHSVHRQPVINRGYFARVQAMRDAVLDFIDDAKKDGKDTVQIVSLGAGLDTTYWWLREQEEVKGIRLGYLELDMPEVVDRKSSMVMRREALWSCLGNSKDDLLVKDGCGARCIRADEYRSACCDLRSVETVSAALAEIGFQTVGVPTMYIAECVLVYMPPESSDRLLSWMSGSVKEAEARVLAYEQCNPDDPFGRVMMENLKNRGCPLLGLGKYPTVESQRRRYEARGFKYRVAEDMLTVYDDILVRARRGFVKMTVIIRT
ncbi:hypothetical protein FOZ60_012128 [Perkinsus olseni]|uniref:Leucine carboxyl methyltransferase 1 n=1 Tax=Perkinsus olseni TaxID=32597 RepID=A0A7J6NBZ4_PEROL|nr:hypothetical protein FOZ60_012128 [Perkinsus olseni]